MAVTAAEILAAFTQGAAITNNDQILLHSAAGVSGNNAVKITAEVLRLYLLQGFQITIGADGYWYIGGQKTNMKAEGVTPEFARQSDGIYVSVDHGTTWTCVAYFSDFNASKVVQQTQTTVNILPNVLNIWGSVDELSIGFVAGSATNENEYKLQFVVGDAAFTLTLPSDVVWQERPRWEVGKTYQVSVLNNLALYAEWEAA
jgi:O-glycosyl hydrolase